MMSRPNSPLAPAQKNVLIVAPGDDLHALAVQHQIARLYAESVQCLIFDPSTYPIASAIDWDLGGERLDIALRLMPALSETIGDNAKDILAGRDPLLCAVVPLDTISGIWWRRAREVIIHREVTTDDFRLFCLRTATSIVRAFVAACPVHNPIQEEIRADRKPFQLWLAQKEGLVVPRTLVTSDPEKARAFVREMWQGGKEVIHKHAASGTAAGIPTRLVQDDDWERLDTLRYAPAVFQERIKGGVDLRVVVIGHRIFSAEWRPEVPDLDAVDVRLLADIRMWPAECPDSIRSKLLSFHDASGLTFGVYDFKINGDGYPFFLEVNPSGQWLDMELEAGHPISEAWARVLVKGLGSEQETALGPLPRAQLQELAGPHVTKASLNWSRFL